VDENVLLLSFYVDEAEASIIEPPSYCSFHCIVTSLNLSIYIEKTYDAYVKSANCSITQTCKNLNTLQTDFKTYVSNAFLLLP
jgi:hypothetical protein